jgi:DNA-binding CsgD family transcriptional regulator
MRSIAQPDCEKLLGVTAELHEIEDRESLPARFLGSLQSLIPFQLGGCHLIQPSRHHIAAYYAPERSPLPTRHKEFWRLAETHPLHSLLFAQPAQAWKLSDVISRQAFHRTEFYNVLYRPLHVDCELTAAFPDPATPDQFCLVSLHRQSNDFTERDRVLLNLLLPQLAGICRRLARRSASANGHSCLDDESSFHDWICQHTRWGLSRRESEVLFWLCQGKTNSEIGSILGIAGRTAETHTLRIYPKMGVENRYTAIAALSHMAISAGS